MKKRKSTGKNRYKRKKKWPRRMLISGLALLLGTGGADYYQNRNLDRTLRILGQAGNQITSVLGIGDHIFGQWYDNNSAYTSLSDIPEYTGEPYVVLNNNVPDFYEDEIRSGAFEYYSDLDRLGRCGMAEAMITRQLMPTKERGEIGMIRPSGWHTVKYDNIDGRYLYNRCHLIAYELTGENANERNLITGTRYMNVEGMLPWENMVAQYVRRTNDKVIYRVTPVYKGKNLVASGVHMEAESIGSSQICFNIFVFNVQPGIEIDYATGDSYQRR